MTQMASEVKEISLDLQGMVAGTVVSTADGDVPVEFLAAGDRVVTRSGMRVVRAVQVQVLRRAVLVRIGAETLGVGQPGEDVLVPAGQPVLVRDWRAQAMFGQKQALVAARRLVDGHWIRSEAAQNVRLFTLQFDAAEVVYANGLELGCTPQPVAA